MQKNRKVTVLTYHYVRPIKQSRYPGIRGLETENFRSQLNYLEKNYTFITIQDLSRAVKTGGALPEKAVLLTFNDALSDHYENVFPILDEKGIQGCFYPETAAIKERKVLLNHKIHFILAVSSSIIAVKEHVFSMLDDLRAHYNLEPNEYYYQKLATASAYDSKDIIFIKRLLQVELEEDVSQEITDQLFNHFVGIDEEVFHRELYLSSKQLKCMINHGMHFGIPGYNHRRFSKLEKKLQKKEITRAKAFLDDLYEYEEDPLLTVSYPWGDYNKDTLAILENLNCDIAFTARPNVANLNLHSKLELPRLDTNELPKERQAVPDEWYSKA